MEDEFGFINVIIRPKVLLKHEKVIVHSELLAVKDVVQFEGPTVKVLETEFKSVRISQNVLGVEPRIFH